MNNLSMSLKKYHSKNNFSRFSNSQTSSCRNFFNSRHSKCCIFNYTLNNSKKVHFICTNYNPFFSIPSSYYHDAVNTLYYPISFSSSHRRVLLLCFSLHSTSCFIPFYIWFSLFFYSSSCFQLFFKFKFFILVQFMIYFLNSNMLLSECVYVMFFPFISCAPPMCYIK